MVGAQYLAEKHAQGHEWRVDAIDPTHVKCCQSLLDQFRGKNVTKGEISVLQKLML
jgi:hypothetical protein